MTTARNAISKLAEPIGGLLTVLAGGMTVYGWVSVIGQSLSYQQLECSLWALACGFAWADARFGRRAL